MHHLSEILIHLGEERQNYFKAVSPPVIQTSNFTFNDLEDFRTSFTNELTHHIYSRGNNPTVEILRKKMAALEGAEDALITGSGSGAIATAVIANVKAGDHVVCVKGAYTWTNVLLTQLLPRFGVSATFVDGRNSDDIADAIQNNTTLLYLESPTSLTFELQDLSACAQLAKTKGITTIADNSYASPIFQNPIKLGIDLVVHSGTKYLNGHSDVVMGVICGSRSMIRKIFETEYMTLGGILAPHDANLVIRGLRTLELRLKRSAESALKIAEVLEEHPSVEKVLYPFLPSFPQYELAKKQMRGAGGLFSVYLKAGSKDQVEKLVGNINRFLLAVSWGGYESLMMPAVGFYDIPGRPDTTTPWNLVRFYVGLEDPDWLLEDLLSALKEL